MDHAGQEELYTAGIVVVSCGASNSAKLPLASASDKHPNGLANGSDQVVNSGDVVRWGNQGRALEPDATMVSRAEAANARLRENVSTGYALDALHAPHITVLQRHVRTRDLASLYLAVERVFETEHLAELQIKATGYYHVPYTAKGVSVGLAGIVIEPPAALLRLQQNLIDAVAQFSLLEYLARQLGHPDSERRRWPSGPLCQA